MDGDSTDSLDNLCQCSTTLTVKWYFLMFRKILLCFSLCLLPLFPWLSTGVESLTLTLPLGFYIDTEKKFPELSLLQAALTVLLQPQSLHHLYGPLRSCLQYVCMRLSYQGAQKWCQYSSCSLREGVSGECVREQGGRSVHPCVHQVALF